MMVGATTTEDLRPGGSETIDYQNMKTMQDGGFITQRNPTHVRNSHMGSEFMNLKLGDHEMVTPNVGISGED